MSTTVELEDLFALHVEEDRDRQAVASPTTPRGVKRVRFDNLSAEKRDDDAPFWAGRTMIRCRIIVKDDPRISWWEDFSPEYRESDWKPGEADSPFKKYALYKNAHNLGKANPGEVYKHMQDSQTDWFVLEYGKIGSEKPTYPRNADERQSLIRDGAELKNSLATNNGAAKPPRG